MTKNSIIRISVISEVIFYYLLTFHLFIIFIVDQIVYKEYKRFITLDDFINAPSEVIYWAIPVSILISLYPIIREYFKYKNYVISLKTKK